MSYPTYRQDFEGGTTLGTACPELIDFASAFAIDSSGSHSLTGRNSLKETTFTVSNNIFSNVNDSLAGNVTLSVYCQNGTGNASLSIYSRLQPPGIITTNTYLRAILGVTGIQINQNNAGTLTTLNTPISGAVLPTGVWLCLELRCNGTAITARVVRQDNGQFFVNTGTGSWSGTPQTQTGTATVTGAGGFGFRGGDNTSLYLDDWIFEPAVPVVDTPTFTLTSAGATQQLTAGGFTDPLYGVTWLSSNTGVATVSSAGLVTAVAAGTATITATGKRDTAQTATSNATITTTGASSYTFTAPSPPSGYTNNVSAAFTVTPNGVYTGSITITPNSGFGLSVIGHTWSASAAPFTFTITPTAPGLVVLTPTNSGGLTDASPLSYGSTAQGLAVSPVTFTVSVPATATLTGTGTRWLTVPPAPTITGVGATGTSLGVVTVVSDTLATVLVSPGTTTGSLVFHDTVTSATATATVQAAGSTTGYMSSVVGFASGLVGSVGYTVLRSDGSTYAARTTAGVFALGSAGYAALVSIPVSGAYVILWDDGSGHFAIEVINPVGVEAPSVAFPIGLNQQQILSMMWAEICGLTSGYTGSFPATISSKAPDGITNRVTGIADGLGNRVTPLTLNPPV